MRYIKELTALTVVFRFAGCTSPTVPDPDPVDTTYGSDTGGATTDDVDDSGWGTGTEIPWEQEGENLPAVIYFEFDSSDIRASDADTVRRHAILLADNPDARVLLEGHADERGSREYNIGLGERRAQSVRRALMFQGARTNQIRTVSFGEERPAATGSNEAAYSQNRRVEIRYGE